MAVFDEPRAPLKADYQDEGQEGGRDSEYMPSRSNHKLVYWLGMCGMLVHREYSIQYNAVICLRSINSVFLSISSIRTQYNQS